MTRHPRTRRPGYTLFEMLVVVAILLVIGVVVLPTVTGMTGDLKVKGAGDAVKGRLMEARLNAMDQGRPYVVSVSPEGTTVRFAPDENVQAEVSADGTTLDGITTIEQLPDDITVSLVATGTNPIAATSDGYQILATFQPDGTCAADSPEIQVKEGGAVGVVIHVRGLTGAVTSGKPATVGGMQ